MLESHPIFISILNGDLAYANRSILDQTSYRKIERISLGGDLNLVSKTSVDPQIGGYAEVYYNISEKALFNEANMYFELALAGVTCIPEFIGITRDNDGNLMFLMEYIPGYTMDNIPISLLLANLNQIISDVYSSLAQIHTNNFVWKDLNAGCIRITPENHIFFIDPEFAINTASLLSSVDYTPLQDFYRLNFSITFPSRTMLANEEIRHLADQSDLAEAVTHLEQKLAVGAILTRCIGLPVDWDVNLSSLEVLTRKQELIALGWFFQLGTIVDTPEWKLLTMDLRVIPMLRSQKITLDTRIESYLQGILNPFLHKKVEAGTKFQEFLSSKNTLPERDNKHFIY